MKELLPGQQRCLIQFSPDGRWLAKGGVEAWLWAVGSWQPQSTIKNAWLPVFTADGSMAAVGVARHVIALVDPTTGREFARLEDPNQDLSEWYAYTPDGTRMVTSSSGENGYSIHVWDLRLIRHQLAELGLDWHLPAYPPASEGTSPSAPAPRRFDVVGVERVTDPAKWQRDEEAETLARLAANPFDVEARYLLGRRLYEQGRWEPAYRHLGFALALQPEFSPAHYFRAWAATRLGRWDEALADLNIVAEHEPTHPSVRWVRGLVYQRLQRHAEAVADFTADAARHPRDGQVLERRAASYEALGRKAEAEADREKALALSPTASLLNERAWNLVTGGQRNPEKALGLIREAMKKEPGNALYLNTLGVVQYRLGRYEEAVTTLEKSLAAGKGESDAFDLFFLAMCYHRLGESDKARDRFDRAVRWVERRQKELDPGAREELRAFRAEAEELLRSPAP